MNDDITIYPIGSRKFTVAIIVKPLSKIQRRVCLNLQNEMILKHVINMQFWSNVYSRINETLGDTADLTLSTFSQLSIVFILTGIGYSFQTS